MNDVMPARGRQRARFHRSGRTPTIESIERRNAHRTPAGAIEIEKGRGKVTDSR